MIAGIYTNLEKDTDLIVTKSLMRLFAESGIKFFLHEKMRGIIEQSEYFSLDDTGKVGVLISIGGDGTILGLADFCMKADIPLIGVNKGRVGFLNEVEPDELDTIVAIIKNENRIVDERRLLEVRAGGQAFYALNEAILYRNDEAKIITLDVSIRGQLVERCCCDGFIVSTPTGSTAYSLSAGGPIASPYADINILTPINSHTLGSRPIVVGADEVVEMKLTKLNRGARVMVDGSCVYAASVGEVIEVTGASKRLKFLRKSDVFYTRLLQKLNILGTTQVD